MPTRHSRLLASLSILAILSSYGCEIEDQANDRINPTGPSQITFSGVAETLSTSTASFSRGVTLQPPNITALQVPGAVCPAQPPFLAPLTLVIAGEREADLFLHHLDLRFVDRFGVFGGSMTLLQSQLLDLFGSVRIPPLSTRAFPLSFPFGCSGHRAGTLTIVVFASTALGHGLSRSLTVSVR